MLNLQYEEFLVEILSTWLNEGNDQSGRRFHYQFPDSNDSEQIYKQLLSSEEGKFEYEGVTLHYKNIGASKLVFVRHRDNQDADSCNDCFSESYISMLRDKVAGQSGAFEGTSLLILHNSLLDTLLGTSDDLKLGAWAHDEIVKKIRDRAADLIRTKPAVEFILKFQSQTLKDEGSSIFGLRNVFETVASEGQFDLRPLGFLKDDELTTWSGKENAKQAEKRLKKNKELKDKIESVLHHYPDEVAEHLPSLGDKFVKKHITGSGDWRALDYQDFENEMKVHSGDVLSYADLNVELGSECVGPRERGASAAKKRDMHLICVMNKDQKSLRIKIEFNTVKKDLKVEQISLVNNVLPFSKSIDSKGKGRQTLTVETDAFDGIPEFLRIRLVRDNTKEKFSFSVLIVQDGDFYVKAFANSFVLSPKDKTIALHTKETQLIVNPELSSKVVLNSSEEEVDVSQTGVVDYSTLYETTDSLQFCLKSGEHSLKFNVEGEVNTQTLRLPLLLDQGRFGRLFHDDYNGAFTDSKGRVVLDNSECNVVADRRQQLQREEEIIREKFYFSGDNPLRVEGLELVYPDLHDSYCAVLDYCEQRQTSPSLVSWGDEYRATVKRFILSYEKALNGITKGVSLTSDQRQLMKLGFGVYEGKEYITPFHPLVLSYYWYLVELIRTDSKGSFKNLPSVTTSRLNAKGLLPFVFSGEGEFGFTQASESNMFWLEVVPQKDSSYSFVVKLVQEKLDELIKTFSSLFSGSNSAPLVINSVNNGKNHEVFLGVLEYIKKHKLKSKSIHLNLYGSEDYTTEFEDFAEMSSYDAIKKTYNFKGNAESDQVIDLLRTRVSFSKFTDEEVSEHGLEWSHISFFKNNEKISATSHNVDEHLSGVACDGILSGESSFREGENYFTAFGLKRVDDDAKPHLRIARLVNNLLRPARQPNEAYRDSSALRLAVNDRFKAQLELCYKNSLWTTIIDPKVTLNFFNQAQDLILIHYSDQYTNSAGYDAITVTSHADLYNQMLSGSGEHLLGEFNAFNGEWLLKMVSSNDKTKLERKGIIATWKLVCGLLAKSEISWIPLSIAEMVRVSGNIGLKLSGGDFSRYFKSDQFHGKMSDDVLFVGFKGDKLFLLPVEVKTGGHNSGSMSKACEQVVALRDYLVNGLLALDSLEGKIYRGLFIRQVLMQVEKYKLYNVFKDDQFKHLMNQREEFLKGDYELAELQDYPAGLVVGILTNDSCIESTADLKGEVLQIELPASYLNKMLSTPLAELVADVQAGFLNLDDQCYLISDEVKKVEDQPTVVDVEPISLPEEEEVTEPEVESETDAKTTETPEASGQPLTIKFGENVAGGEPVLWEPTNSAKVLNTNTGIIGTMGTGKTQFTKSMITQLVQNQKDNVGDDPIGVLIFDYKADYIKDDFIEATGVKVFELYDLPFNPFSLFGNKPMLPVHTANLFRSTMGNAYGLGMKQQNKIRTLIVDAYQAAGIYANKPETWSRPAPTMNDVWNLFNEDENVAQDSLYAALDDLIQFQIFEPKSENTKSLFDLMDGVVVINLSGYDPQIQNLIVAITLDVFYSQMHHLGSSRLEGDYRQISKMILVDEADNFMTQEFESLKKILKEGREFGVGTILSTQELTHFKTSNADYSSYILTWIIHKVSQIKNQDVKSIFNAEDRHEENALMKKVRELDKHFSLYVDGDKKITKMKDLAFWELLEKNGQ